jgi:hypothetical protein
MFDYGIALAEQGKFNLIAFGFCISIFSYIKKSLFDYKKKFLLLERKRTK